MTKTSAPPKAGNEPVWDDALRHLAENLPIEPLVLQLPTNTPEPDVADECEPQRLKHYA